MSTLRRSWTSAALTGLFLATTLGSAAAATPFKVVRAVVNPSGTLYLAGAGLTVTHPSTGHYHVAFVAGTWTTNIGGLTTPCYFIPQVQPLYTSATANISAYVTAADGSGSIDIMMSSGADATLALVFTSANC